MHLPAVVAGEEDRDLQRTGLAVRPDLAVLREAIHVSKNRSVSSAGSTSTMTRVSSSAAPTT